MLSISPIGVISLIWLSLKLCILNIFYVIIICVFGYVGFFYGKKAYDKVRKKRIYEIEDNYESAIKAIKKKLYFKDKDLEKVSIFYYDEDNLENDVDEDSFDEAYESGKWGIGRKDEDEENNEAEEKEDKKGISEDQLKEEKEKLEKELRKKIQKEVNEKVKQKLEELKNKFKKIANEKISANNSKYEKKIKD